MPSSVPPITSGGGAGLNGRQVWEEVPDCCGVRRIKKAASRPSNMDPGTGTNAQVAFHYNAAAVSQFRDMFQAHQ